MCLSWEKKHATLIPNCHPAHTWSLDYHACPPLEERRRSCDISRADPKKRKLHTDLVAIAQTPSALGPLRASFDVVVCNQVFEHVKQPFVAARGIKHLLKPGTW